MKLIPQVKLNKILLATSVFLALMLWWKIGSVSYTFDEAEDSMIVNCLQRSISPFECRQDLTQTRLIYFIHLAFREIIPGGSLPEDYILSSLFSIVNLLLVFGLVKRLFDKHTAEISAILYVTSIQILASGRMIMTHSSVILTTFTLLTLISLLNFIDHKKLKHLIMLAFIYGLSLGVSVLSCFTGLFILMYYFFNLRSIKFQWWHLTFPVITAIVFFCSTVIYLDERVLKEFIDLLFIGYKYPYWNYLNLGSAEATWYFSLVIFIIKFTPWMALTLLISIYLIYNSSSLPAETKRFSLAFSFFFLIYLLLKSTYFKYDAPHHQVQFYPLLLGVAAYSIRRLFLFNKVRAILIIVSITVVQLISLISFFPDLIFYGAQYGDRFLGEFYGPAVMHAQHTNDLQNKIKEISSIDKSAKFFLSPANGFMFSDPRFEVYTFGKPLKGNYALADYCNLEHFNFPENQAYKDSLKKCTEIYTTYFPGKKWMYRLYKCP